MKVGRLTEGQVGLASVARGMLDQGCTAVILGCTEISVALGAEAEFREVTVDASAALARMASKQCGARLSSG